MQDEIPEDLIRPSQAAKLVGCHMATVCRWVMTGKLRGWKLAGRRYLVSRADVQAMLEPVAAVGRIPVTPPPQARRMKSERAKAELLAAGFRY